MRGLARIVGAAWSLHGLAVALATIIVVSLLRVRSLILASRDTDRGEAIRRSDRSPGRSSLGRAPRVAAVVITLNEAAQIEQCLEHLLTSDPPFSEVIVCDGGSTDATVDIVEEFAETSGRPRGSEAEPPARGASRPRIKFIASAAKGRAAQLNAGAAHAERADAIVFVHADSRPPRTCVHHVRRTLFKENDPGKPTDVGLVGFPTRIAMFDESGPYSPTTSETRILWLTTIHEYIAYWMYVLLFQPVSYLRGLRCLFGDQNLALRTPDFDALGGFDDSLRIMEDLDICLRVVETLGKSIVRAECFGASSGRRIAQWGEGRATVIHFRIAVVWYTTRVAERIFGGRWPWVQRLLRREYETVYTDDAR